MGSNLNRLLVGIIWDGVGGGLREKEGFDATENARMNEFWMREANLPFGRVDIDIDCLGIKMDKYDKLWMSSFW